MNRYIHISFLVLAPAQCSEGMRHFIQALLVAYAEPQLNATEPATEMPVNSDDESPPWYHDFVHPRRCIAVETI